MVLDCVLSQLVWCTGGVQPCHQTVQNHHLSSSPATAFVAACCMAAVLGRHNCMVVCKGERVQGAKSGYNQEQCEELHKACLRGCPVCYCVRLAGFGCALLRDTMSACRAVVLNYGGKECKWQASKGIPAQLAFLLLYRPSRLGLYSA